MVLLEVFGTLPDGGGCCDLQVSPTMSAEELTNQVLFMRNVPAGDKDLWMTFEAMEDGQLGETARRPEGGPWGRIIGGAS